MAVIQVEGAGFSYQAGQKVFSDLSFSLEVGEVFCVIGPNGCGKSTLIDSLLGLHKLDEGHIRIAERPLSDYSPRSLAERLAYIPQNHRSSFPYTVLDVVLMGCARYIGPLSSPGQAQLLQANEALASVGLESFAQRPYTELSGGELQLVLVARALAQNAQILLMDEPTAHLDFRHELRVMEIIGDLVLKKSLSIVMATHFLNQAYYLENAGVPIRVALMNHGRFEKVGRPEEILSEENLKSVFRVIASVAREGSRKFILPLKNEVDFL